MNSVYNEINKLIPHNLTLSNIMCLDYNYFLNKSNRELDDEFNYIKNQYKLFILHFSEEFIYDEKTITIIDKCIEIKLKLLIYSLNPVLEHFIKLKYPSEIIYTNDSYTLFNDSSLKHNLIILNKSIKLLFLNYNRRANRDFIILKLKKIKELDNQFNYISFHNKFKFNNKPYEDFYLTYVDDYNIDINFLNNFQLIPNKKVDIDNQAETQIESYELYSKSKFNIICEPFFGYYTDINSYEYYSHIITKKTILPLLYKNVFFIYEYNNLLSFSLIKLGFKLFFDNLDHFLNNMNDDYLLLESTIEKLNHNQELVIKLLDTSKFEFYNKLKILLNEI
jgi:hypothetical protein